MGMQGIFPARVAWHWSSLPGSVRVFFSSGSAGACWFWMWLSRSPFSGFSNPAITSALLPATGKAKTLMFCIPPKLSLSVSQQKEGCWQTWADPADLCTQTELWPRIIPSQRGTDQSYRERFPIAPLEYGLSGQVLARAGPLDVQHVSETI